MQRMILTVPSWPLQLDKCELLPPGPDQILVKVHACGVCRTDLHVVDGELAHAKLPLVPGHEVIGRIAELGARVDNFDVGDRVGVPWLGYTCGKCHYCQTQRENLCDYAKFTGYTLDGGYAEYVVADRNYCFKVPDNYSDINAAPLLCAGLIGYRSFCQIGDAVKIGLYGFGAAAHIIAQIAIYQGRQVYAFTRPGDISAQRFATRLGADWSGDSNAQCPQRLDAAIIFAPVGPLVPAALKGICKGGKVVCAGIHMSDIPQFPYELLWGERSVCSVANLTRHDGESFLKIAREVTIKTEVHPYRLEDANHALVDLRSGNFQSAAVLVP